MCTVTTLLPATDELYGFLLGETVHPRLTLPPGGVSPRPILEMLRQLMKPVRASHHPGDWLILDGHEVVGLIGLKAPADAEGKIDFGYGVADSRQRRGHASRAVALMLMELARDPKVRLITAENAVDNIASQRVLEKNGFVRTGTRIDPEDGEVICWRAC
jgi:RimJ/RimL family protein N-acetyltransferase